MIVLVHHAQAIRSEVDAQRPLSETGRAHAERLAHETAARGVKPDVIWHSGKLRARQTADPFWKLCNPFAEFAAVRGLPCPSDAMIARAYGTHSARRARRLLGYFEEHGLIVIHADFSGKRIVAFPDLGSETAPGDANGPDMANTTATAAE